MSDRLADLRRIVDEHQARLIFRPKRDHSAIRKDNCVLEIMTPNGWGPRCSFKDLNETQALTLARRIGLPEVQHYLDKDDRNKMVCRPVSAV